MSNGNLIPLNNSCEAMQVNLSKNFKKFKIGGSGITFLFANQFRLSLANLTFANCNPIRMEYLLDLLGFAVQKAH